MTLNRRFIEEYFPVKGVSVEAANEKYLRKGNIQSLHIWWARRPLAASRATVYASLIPPPTSEDEWEKQKDFIINLSKWENSTNLSFIEKAKEKILNFYGGVPPKVLDPFGGGGSIPLECLRLGCDTYTNDYNPVAVLIQNCTIKIPQKYGVNEDSNSSWGDISVPSKKQLVTDIINWAEWILNQAKIEIGHLYPPDSDGYIPVGYLWARTIPCQNPVCGKDIPLIKQFWLAKRKNKKVAYYPTVKNDRLTFKIVGDGYDPFPEDFNPDIGTVSRAVGICPICGSTIDANTTRRLFKEGKSSSTLIAIVLHKPGTKGKKYRIANNNDMKLFHLSSNLLEKKILSLRDEWGIEPIPDEPTPEGKGSGAERAFSLRNYGMNCWGDLFNERQKLVLLTFSEKVRLAYQEMLKQNINDDYAKALCCYLSLIVDRIADYNSVVCVWHNGNEQISHTFGRNAIQITFDYIESNQFGDSSGSFSSIIKSNKDLFNLIILPIKPKCIITQQSATNLNFEDNFFDAIFTDPPYYDNIPYSYLSDFFYVWLKRMLGSIYPEYFSTSLTPKKQEIVAYSNLPGGFEEGKQFFESMLKKSFQEIYRILKPNGIAVIVYAHKSTEGWETLTNSLLDSGLVMTGAWPLNTEMAARLRSNESAALASSIYIVARKMDRQSTGFYNNVKEELKQHLNQKLDRLWQEGISGADFFIAAIGSAIEVFGKYEEVMDYEGNIVRADRMLAEVRKIATDYAVRQILHNGFSGEISDLSRFYVLWRWNYGEAKVPFDEARKLGQSCGIDVAQEWVRNGFILKEKEFVRVIGPQDRKIENLKEARDLVDILHRVLLFWEKSKRDEMISVLQESGYGASEAFFRVAQAISETLPIESKEKKLLDGFLAGRERVREEVEKKTGQVRLDV